MSDLAFTPYCGNPYCFAQINSGKGLVLSCGCFLCNKCGATFNELCPGCKNRGVRAVCMDNLPTDVAAVTADSALDFERIFTALKFQISHYKRVLALTSNIIQRQNAELDTIRRFVEVTKMPAVYVTPVVEPSAPDPPNSSMKSSSVMAASTKALPWKSGREGSADQNRHEGIQSQPFSGGHRPSGAPHRPAGVMSNVGLYQRRPQTPTNVNIYKSQNIRDKGEQSPLCDDGLSRWGPSQPSTPISAAAKGLQSYSGSTPVRIRQQGAVPPGYVTPSRVRSPYSVLSSGGSGSSSTFNKQTRIGRVISQHDLNNNNRLQQPPP